MRERAAISLELSEGASAGPAPGAEKQPARAEGKAT